MKIENLKVDDILEFNSKNSIFICQINKIDIENNRVEFAIINNNNNKGQYYTYDWEKYDYIIGDDNTLYTRIGNVRALEKANINNLINIVNI